MQKYSGCPFSRLSNSHYKASSPASQTTSRGQVSFAEYVNSLGDLSLPHETKTPRPSHDEYKPKVGARTKTLPKLEEPEFTIMKSQFVLNSGKRRQLHSIKPRSTLQTEQLQVRSLKSSFVKPKTPLVGCYHQVQSHSSGKLDESIFFERIGGEETLSRVVSDFHEMSKGHPKLEMVGDEQMYKGNFLIFLEYIMGKPVFFNLETLKQKHMALHIRNKEFNLFKSYLMSSFLKFNKGPPELVFEFSALIEQYRYVIIPREKTFAQIYNQKVENKNNQVPESIYYLAHSAYEKIFADTTLSAYFQGIEIDNQARKLGKIMSQLMGWDTHGSEAVLALLRDSHRSMRLTNVHFTLFKQHMIQSMREIGITDKQIELVTQRMDGYRCCIVDQDTLLDFFRQSPTMMSSMIKKYEGLLKKDYRLKHLPSLVIEKHAVFVMRYITHQHLPNPTRADLLLLHKRCAISQEWLDAFRENFFVLIKPINLHPLAMQDYHDIWFHLRYSIIVQQSIAKQIGDDMLDHLQDKLTVNFQDNENYNYHFRNVDYHIKYHIKRIMAFIFRNLQAYKSNDLRVIHQGLKIPESTFRVFVHLIRVVMEQEQIPKPLIREAEIICHYYKPCICNL